MNPSTFDQLVDTFQQNPSMVCLTGAGVSLASGIPTYRDREGDWQVSTPILHQAFLDEAGARQRYWTRSFSGWPAFAAAQPNPAHLGLQTLLRQGPIDYLVTQNVDSLHEKAGSQPVYHLHGTLDWVDCLACTAAYSREAIQETLATGRSRPDATAILRPDGDADLEFVPGGEIQIPICSACGGDLKPRVVFFGGTVDADLVEKIYSVIRTADALLVVGSSLKLFSGYRFCRYAVNHRKPLLIINPGWTRADDLATLKLSTPAELAIPRLCAALGLT